MANMRDKLAALKGKELLVSAGSTIHIRKKMDGMKWHNVITEVGEDYFEVENVTLEGGVVKPPTTYAISLVGIIDGDI